MEVGLRIFDEPINGVNWRVGEELKAQGNHGGLYKNKQKETKPAVPGGERLKYPNLGLSRDYTWVGVLNRECLGVH